MTARSTGKTDAAICNYDQLLKTLSAMVAEAENLSRSGRNSATLDMYWRVGEQLRIAGLVEGEKAVTQRLSKDLNARFESGFSMRNLQYMRRFSQAFARGSMSPALNWTHYRTLLSVTDDAVRQALYVRALTERLPTQTLVTIVRAAEGLGAEQLPRRPGTLGLCKVLAPGLENVPAGMHVIDLGFETRMVTSTPGVKNAVEGELLTRRFDAKGAVFSRTEETERRYAFGGRVERVIDGDTIIALLSIGFGLWRRQRLRLKGVDAAPLKTAAGEKSFRFVKRQLKEGSSVAVETFRMDLHGRFEAFVFYDLKRPDADPASLIEKGRFLNQELLNRNMAIRVEI